MERIKTDDHAGLYFEEEFLPVQQVSDEHPQRSSTQALEELLPAEWKVETPPPL